MSSMICVRKYSSRIALTSKHAAFLNVVKNHGEGSVSLAATSSKGIYCLQLSNLSKMNSVSGKMMFDLASSIDQIVENCHSENSIRGIIVRGDGNAFCSGADFTLAKNVLVTPELGLAMSSFMTDALNTLRNSNVISVCLINGPAIGKIVIKVELESN